MATGDITFALRGTTTTAYRSFSGSVPGKHSGTEDAVADVGAIGGSTIDLVTDGGSGNRHILVYNALNNIPSTQAISVLFRGKLNSFFNLNSMFEIETTGATGDQYLGAFHRHDQDQFNYGARNGSHGTRANNFKSTVNVLDTSTYYDFLVTDTGDTGTSQIQMFLDTTLITTTTTQTIALSNPRDILKDRVLRIGQYTGINACEWYVNEFVIFEGVVDPTSILLETVGDPNDTSLGSLNGASRTKWVACDAFDGLVSTDPGAANVLTGNDYTFEGVSQTATLVQETWSTITAAEIKSGVNQIQNSTNVTGTYLWNTIPAANIETGINTIQDSATITGTFTGNWTSITAAQIADGVNQIQNGLTQTGSLASEVWSTIAAAEIKSGVNQIQNSNTVTGTYLWSSLAAANIRAGFDQIQDSVTISGSFTGETWSTLGAEYIAIGETQVQNSVTITGTLLTPIAVGGTSTVVNIPNIKETIRFVLDQNNTTTSSVGDLSASMSQRVKKIAKINPDKLPLQASVYPCVTIYTDRKSIEVSDIAPTQVGGKRRTNLTFKLIGIVFNTDYQTDVFNDSADEDLEKLMENVEGILRNYPDLGKNIKWQFPTDVTYHSTTIGEDAHMRIGVLDLQATLFY